MRNKRRNRLLLWTMVLAWGLLQACETQRSPCLEPVTAQLNLRCYQRIDSNNTFIDSLLPNANLVSLDIDSARNWYRGAKQAGSFGIVLSPLRDTARWMLEPDSAVTAMDTLTFIYRRRLVFLSNACGYGYSYMLERVWATKYNIDSVAVNSPEVTTKAGTEHVRIYL